MSGESREQDEHRREQEAEARVRNDKVTPPLVAMALLFMVLIIYPALDLD